MLTDKQRQVLDLLMLRMTSKEIASRLGISPYTVDQRIVSARQKLSATSRSDIVIKYRAWLATQQNACEKTAYENSDMPISLLAGQDGDGNSTGPRLANEVPPKARLSGEIERETRDIRVVPEMFDGQYGSVIRIVALLATVILLLISGVVGLALFGQLSDLTAR